MPQFTYVAMDGKGKEQKGKMTAANEEAVMAALRAKGMFPTSIKQEIGKDAAKKMSSKGGAKKGGGGGFNMTLGPMVIKRKELTVVTRQLAILLDAGLPLIRSLHTLEKQAKNPVVRVVLAKTAETVEGGATFAEALSQNPKSFDKLYLNMVRAGEASGAMETILDRLAAFMEKSAKIAGKVKSAMIYPIVVLSISLLAVVGLMIFIVPNFEKIFKDLLGPNEPLPGVTMLILGISNTLISHWYYYVGGVYRIHQFEKQEMIVVCEPEDSYDWYNKMWSYTVELFRNLDIPVRTLECCSGDLADLKSKSVDVEAWSPRQKKYFEVGSCSNLTDAQSRRLGIRIKGENGNYFAHTLNNTVVAPPRMLIAFLENNYNEDGSINIPEKLRPYMGMTEKLVPKK